MPCPTKANVVLAVGLSGFASKEPCCELARRWHHRTVVDCTVQFTHEEVYERLIIFVQTHGERCSRRKTDVCECSLHYIIYMSKDLSNLVHQRRPCKWWHGDVQLDKLLSHGREACTIQQSGYCLIKTQNTYQSLQQIVYSLLECLGLEVSQLPEVSRSQNIGLHWLDIQNLKCPQNMSRISDFGAYLILEFLNLHCVKYACICAFSSRENRWWLGWQPYTSWPVFFFFLF